MRIVVVIVLAILSGPQWGSARTCCGQPPAQSAPKRLKALLVTGGCCHDYPRQEQILAAGMESRLGPIQWTVVNYGKEKTGELKIYENENWAGGYDFVVHNECYGGVTDSKIVANIVNGHVKTGVPAVAIHCSMHSYRDADNADQWRAFLGVTSRFHEKAKRSLTVVPADLDHPVMRGFPNPWKTPNGELYIILKTYPDMHVLATAYSDQYEKNQPVVWTNEYKGVRLFATSLGHHNVTMESDEWLDMTARGIQWAMLGSDRDATENPPASKESIDGVKED